MPNLNKYVVQYAGANALLDEEILNDEGFRAFLDKINAFSISLAGSFSNSTGKNSNYCISPAAIFMSLAVASECANGETRDEILDAIGITYEELNTYTKYYYSLFNKAYTYIDTYGNEHVSAHEVLATSIWMNQGSKYNFSCVNALSKNYNCDSYAINFADGTAEKVINQYIEYKTHNVVAGNVRVSNSADFSIIRVVLLVSVHMNPTTGDCTICLAMSLRCVLTAMVHTQITPMRFLWIRSVLSFVEPFRTKNTLRCIA